YGAPPPAVLFSPCIPLLSGPVPPWRRAFLRADSGHGGENRRRSQIYRPDPQSSWRKRGVPGSPWPRIYKPLPAGHLEAAAVFGTPPPTRLSPFPRRRFAAGDGRWPRRYGGDLLQSRPNPIRSAPIHAGHGVTGLIPTVPLFACAKAHLWSLRSVR